MQFWNCKITLSFSNQKIDECSETLISKGIHKVELKFIASLIVPDDISIRRLSFRDKRLGWKKFSMSFDYASKRGNGSEIVCHYSEPLNKDPFLRGFLSDLYLRPSCHRCPAKELKSGADFTIGDFWALASMTRNLMTTKAYRHC